MKSAFAAFSNVVGLIMARLRISLFHEVQRLIANKNRILVIAGLFMSGIILLISGLLLAAIESAWQYDSQGFVAWNAMEVLAAGMVGLAVILFVSARYAIPLREVSQPSLAETLHDLGVAKIIDDFLARIQKKYEPPTQSTVPPQRTDTIRFDSESPAAH